MLGVERKKSNMVPALTPSLFLVAWPCVGPTLSSGPQTLRDLPHRLPARQGDEED